MTAALSWIGRRPGFAAAMAFAGILSLYTLIQFGDVAASRAAIALALLLALDGAQQRTESMLRRTGIAVLQALTIYGLAFAPAPFGFGSDIPAQMMVEMPLFFILCCVLARSFSVEHPVVVLVTGLVVTAMWISILPLARLDPHLITKADIVPAQLRRPEITLMAINQPHYFNRGIWQNEVVVLLLVTTLFTIQAFRIRWLARRSAAQETMRSALASHFAPQVTDLLLGARQPGLPPRRRSVVALDCDLVGFTAIAEACPPEETAELLRAWRSAIESAVFAQGGAIVSFTGDGALAVFGLMEGETEPAIRALAAARQLLRDWTGTAQAAIGIDFGEVLFGLVGEGNALSLLLAGPPVEGAASLQQATRAAGVRVLVSDAAVASEGAGMKGLSRTKADGLDAWAIAD